MTIKDFEFVPHFRYKTEYILINIFDNVSQNQINNIDNIFDFEKYIVQELFDNCLYKIKDGIIQNSNYFGSVESKYCKTDNNYRLILTYRKAFFDYIYKSRENAITGNMFKAICMSGVIDALSDYKYRDKDRAKEDRIKTLLIIYFSLNHHFDINNNNFNQNSNTFNMAETTKQLLEKVKKLVSEDEIFLEAGEDEEFAFDFGQLVYYLLSQSEASKKTHSLLLAYLQKNNFELLKEKAKEDITKYSYKIAFNQKKFNKLCSEVLGYQPKENFSKLSAFFLAGYFSNNVIYL